MKIIRGIEELQQQVLVFTLFSEFTTSGHEEGRRP